MRFGEQPLLLGGALEPAAQPEKQVGRADLGLQRAQHAQAAEGADGHGAEGPVFEPFGHDAVRRGRDAFCRFGQSVHQLGHGRHGYSPLRVHLGFDWEGKAPAEPHSDRWSGLWAKPADEHRQRLIEQGQRVFLPRRGVLGPEGEHADVQRPVQVQGDGRERIADAMTGGDLTDGFQVGRAECGRVAVLLGRLRGQFCVEDGGQVFAKRLELAKGGGNVGEQFFFERQRIRILPIQVCCELLGRHGVGLADQRVGDGFFRGEVVEERADADAGHAGDVAGGGGLESLGGKQLLRCLQDSLPGGRPGFRGDSHGAVLACKAARRLSEHAHIVSAAERPSSHKMSVLT